jgi:hypothetical protein
LPIREQAGLLGVQLADRRPHLVHRSLSRAAGDVGEGRLRRLATELDQDLLVRELLVDERTQQIQTALLGGVVGGQGAQ